MARRSIHDRTDRQATPVDEDARQTGRGIGGAAPADRSEDDIPDVEPENEPPIERSDGQVYGG